MARPLNKLSAAKLWAESPGKYSDGGGLLFHKRDDGGAEWFLRVVVHGRRREEANKLHLLRDIALDAFESRKAELKGDGKAGRWFSPLELHILP